MYIHIYIHVLNSKYSDYGPIRHTAIELFANEADLPSITVEWCKTCCEFEHSL